MNLPDINISNILYPTDLSENARYAFAYAVSLADMYQAKITILHVMPEEQKLLEINVSGYIKPDKWDEIKKSHYQQTRESLIGKQRDHLLIRKVLDHFSENAFNGRELDPVHEIIIERGNPVREILRQSEEQHCDLVIMGSRGHSTLADVMMGSITKRVLRRSKIPVLVVRLPEEESLQ
ncbi:MAG: universal stress protein [Desulfobacteraceae bacterium]